MLSNECWNQLLDKLLSTPRQPIIVYGAAGSGKTSLLLSLAKIMKRRFMYMNTEGSPFHERALQVLGSIPHGSFIVDVHDMRGMLYHLLNVPEEIEVLFIDSINGLYRVEVAEAGDKAMRLFGLINAIGRKYSENDMTVFASAQVSLEEEPSGLEILSHYTSVFLKLLRDGEGKAILGENVLGTYNITEDGIAWRECYRR